MVARLRGTNQGRTFITFTASRLLILIALILFVLAAFGVAIPVVQIVPLGLAFFAASFIVP
jgi:hypothetical protein